MHVINMKRKHGDHHNQDIRLMVTIGFSLVITLLLAIIISGYYTVGKRNTVLSEAMSETTTKIDMAYQMRDAIRQRVDSLKTMLALNDFFDRDEEKIKFYSYAANYAHSREELHARLNTAEEISILEDLDARARAIAPPNKLALELLFNTSYSNQLNEAVHASIDGHLSLLSRLEDLVRLEHDIAEYTVARESEKYNQALFTSTVIGVIALLLAILTAVKVIRSAGKKNEMLSYQASHDALTDLNNRQAFENILDWTIQESREIPAEHVLLFMDLDQFKIVNDTCGHAAGDALLIEISRELLKCLRSSDVLARLGGDEFGVLLRYTSPDNGEQVAEKIRATVDKFAFNWDERKFKIGVSIGLVPFNGKNASLEELLRVADTSCYTAKDQGRNRIHRADHDSEEIHKRTGEMMWVHSINDSIAHNRFVLFGQWINPVQSGTSTEQRMLEILLRMQSDDGLIPPGQFLPAAERYGLMTEIDRWVLDNALAWLASLGELAEQTRISVNIFGKSASDPKFHTYIKERIDHHNIPPSSLCLEITESVAIGSMESAANLIDAVGNLGCRFAIDDFGSGLASFQYLRQLDVDYLKIDGSFIRDIENNRVDYAMVKSINEIGQTLGKRTVAEFVENDSALLELMHIGVDYAQGYAQHRPQPLSEIRQQLLDEAYPKLPQTA